MGTKVLTAEFITDVGEYLKERSLDTVLQDLQVRYRQYKLLESGLVQKKTRLVAKLPEIQKSLDVVLLLLQRSAAGDETVADFQIADGVFTKARIRDVKTVNLWLGANVMVEYPLEEAKELLESNLHNCKTNLKTVTGDLEFLKDQITTTEVSLARVHNYDVEQRRGLKVSSS